jgi:arylsulfatase A-like enzyme
VWAASAQAAWFGASRPDIVLIVLDTVGARDLGVYGSTVARTPAIDRLAAEGVVFRQASAVAPWTKPSMASIYTSRSPSVHGVRHLHDRFPDIATSVVERLQGDGYATAGFVSHDLLDTQTGFGQGFGHYDSSAAGGHRAISSSRVTDLALEWMAKQERTRPIFVVAHYFDAHLVYHHHPAFDQTAGYRGQLAPGMEIWPLRDRRPTMEPTDVDYLRGLHREEVSFVDAAVGRLVQGIRSRNPQAVILLTSDHGEEIMQRGWIGHTRTLYDELIHIPLIVSWPGRIRSGEVDAPVSQLDIAPTVLALARVEADPEAEGMALFSPRGRRARIPDRDLFAEVSFVPEGKVDAEKLAEKRAIMRGAVKVIWDLTSGRWELYDRANDPHERTDRFTSWPGRRPLQRALATRVAAETKSEQRPLTDEEAQQLRALGYLR